MNWKKFFVIVAAAAIVGAIAMIPASTAYYQKNPPVYEEKIEPNVDDLIQFLKAKGATDLIPYVHEIVKLPRWVEVVAIVGKETTFCKYGVGSSRKNCGAIKNAKGDFKVYASVMDSIEDVSILLQKPRYKDKSIEEMNGVYCVHDGGACPMWSEHIEEMMNEIAFASLPK